MEMTEILRGWDHAESMRDLLTLVDKLYDIIVRNPQVEVELNEHWRILQVKFKDCVTKPWSKHLLYMKYKMLTFLERDIEDVDTYMSLFKNRVGVKKTLQSMADH